ncbi:MAG: hypothetical protein JNJ90_12720 [Saprospiraceae bacterium]|jgi:hypothetical protein|nr:hypothetical protein [Saprospiraceae bacterium]
MVNFLLSQSQQAVQATEAAPQVIKQTPFSPSHSRFGCYEEFLQTCLEQGYQFCTFPELREPKHQIALRHDIDFDTNFALQSATIERQMGIKATYFFLLRSSLYNIFSPQDFENVQLIRDMGHTITVHFDPSIYPDFHRGLQQEVALFREIFNAEVGIVSLHRPNAFFQEYDAPIYGIEHTYQSKYFRDVKYISDSTGVWRFGHPFDTPEFKQQKSLHILIHPIWWMLDGESNVEKLRQYYSRRVDALKADFSNNCIPFRKLNGHV